MRSLTQYQEDSTDFVHSIQTWLCFMRPRPMSRHSSARWRSTWLYSWTSSRAALFAAAEFTPLLPLTSFKYICLFICIFQAQLKHTWTFSEPPVGTDNMPVLIFHVSLCFFVEKSSERSFFTILDAVEINHVTSDRWHCLWSPSYSSLVSDLWQAHGCLATWTDDITVRRFKVLSEASLACFPSLSQDKIDASQPTASSPAAACPCGYREVNKLKTKQVTKCNKGQQGVNRA